MTGIPASSKTDAVIASYAVSMGHFSPRSVAAAMSWTVMRRVLLPPYSALGFSAVGPAGRGEDWFCAA